MKKIIIISGNRRLREFFELEALTLGFFAECFEKFEKKHNDLSTYDLSIIDKDTVNQIPLNAAKKAITVSCVSGKADICYPISIKDLRGIYNELFINEALPDKNYCKEFKVIFYKDEKNVVSIKDRKYILSDSEYKLLELLCKRAKQTVLREEIDKLFENGKSNISDVYVCKLRKKLEINGGQRFIFTVREKGYCINIEAEWR